MTHRVAEIAAAFCKVKSSVEKVMSGDQAQKDQAFQEIFALNNEIGRIAREQPKTMPKMKELQAYVNMITVGIKHGRTVDLREGLSLSEETIKALRKDSADEP